MSSIKMNPSATKLIEKRAKGLSDRTYGVDISEG